MNPNYSQDIKNYASFLNRLSPNEFTLLAAAIGVFLSQGLSANQSNSLGNFLEAVGQLMLTYSAQLNLQNSNNS